MDIPAITKEIHDAMFFLYEEKALPNLWLGKKDSGYVELRVMGWCGEELFWEKSINR